MFSFPLLSLTRPSSCPLALYAKRQIVVETPTKAQETGQKSDRLGAGRGAPATELQIGLFLGFAQKVL